MIYQVSPKFIDFVSKNNSFGDFSVIFSIIEDIDINDDLLNKIEIEKKKFPEKIHQKLDLIQDNINMYDSFFESFGYKSPLSYQLKSILNKGFRKINPFIDVLLLSELSNGILFGVQDYDQLKGNLLLDLTGENEIFDGMNGLITCKENEIVLRDEESIIASLYQGPDSKTKISEITNNVIVFAFGIPRIDNSMLETAVKYYNDIFASYCQSINSNILRVN